MEFESLADRSLMVQTHVSLNLPLIRHN